jgi:hypothetical protein
VHCRFDLLPDFDIASWPRTKRVALFGTGTAAQVARNILSDAGVEVVCFIDHHSRQERVANLPVKTLGNASAPLDLDLPIILITQYWVRWANVLKNSGFTELYNGYESVFNANLLSDIEGSLRAVLSLAASAAVEVGVTGATEAAAALEQVVATFKETGPLSGRVNQRSISMMAPQTHAVAQFYARLTQGPIIEVGPYTGGLTVTIAQGAGESPVPRKYAIVEAGGSYVEQPYLPSGDVIADLRHNIGRLTPSFAFELVQGRAQDAETLARVERYLDGERAGMLVIDSDGDLDGTFSAYREFLADGCILVLDDFIDFETEPRLNKSRTTRAGIYANLHRGRFEELNVTAFGTWFGRYVAN